MFPSMPRISFKMIRPHGESASQEDSFEDLISIIIQQLEDWPSGTVFHKFGNPDGGREGNGTLPNGDVWAWQAKYVFKFGSSEANQIKRSIERALEQEPNLKRYFIVLPFDLPAGDSSQGKSAFTKWKEEVEKWNNLTVSKGLDVEFVLMNASKLIELLLSDKNGGLVNYWFNESILTKQDQQRRVEEIIERAGKRYRPKLHVEVKPIEAIDAVGCTPEYLKKWKNLLGRLRNFPTEEWSKVGESNTPLAQVISEILTSVEHLDNEIENTIKSAPLAKNSQLLETHVLKCADSIKALLKQLGSFPLLADKQNVSNAHRTTDSKRLTNRLRTALIVLRHIQLMLTSNTTVPAQNNELLIVGKAGVGKTHLLCDASKRRIDAGYPTIMIFGQDFTDRPLMTQIPEIAELGNSTDELFAILDAAGKANHCIALLAIDAINESQNPERWEECLRALRRKASRFSNVGIVISCRSEYLDSVVGKSEIPIVEHFGLDESTNEAIQRYSSEYGLDLPIFPILNPEYGNPLFLRLSCEALSTLGRSRFNFGTAGLSNICLSFIEATNQRLSSSQRCDFDPSQNLVQLAMRELVQSNRQRFSRDEVEEITSRVLPNRTWSNGLFRGLLNEGLLIDVGSNQIAFGFQRLGDFLHAEELSSKPLTEIRSWFESQRQELWTIRGILGALAITLPEKHNVEIVDISSDQVDNPDLAHSFIDSLPHRESKSIDARTIELVEFYLASENFSETTWNSLVKIACVPRHPLNARWLHDHLLALSLHERDTTWSLWLHGTTDIDVSSPIKYLTDWAWPLKPVFKRTTDPEVDSLGMLALCWLLSTSGRAVRDRATKALISLGAKSPNGFIENLKLTLNVNDLYVTERVIAAACGIALRNASVDTIHTMADLLLEYSSNNQPKHVLIRDYIQMIIKLAGSTGWSGQQVAFSKEGIWPPNPTPLEEIEKLVDAPQYRFSSIWFSLTGLGDFGNYILKSALRNFQVKDHNELLSLTQRIIFDRVRDLGWTPERFDNIDDHLRRGRMVNPVERFGKKYQWIALYEVLGTLTDQFKIQPRFTSDEREEYEDFEQIGWRDIDVTVLARPTNPQFDTHWFSPASIDFSDTDGEKYPHNMDILPDPLELISLTDSDGESWVALYSAPTWSQQHDPEIDALNLQAAYTWMNIHSYLVPSELAAGLAEWAQHKNWFGLWMPGFSEPANLLLGSHPYGSQWSDATGEIEDWEYPSRSLMTDEEHSRIKTAFEDFLGDIRLEKSFDPIPREERETNKYLEELREFELIKCGALYTGTGTDRDYSSEKETTGFVPSLRLFELLGLQHGVDFVWKDESGVAVFDPSTSEGGERTLLLRRSLISRLEETGYSIFWTVLAGNDRQPPRINRFKDDYQWVTGSASYLMMGNSISKIDSCAEICRSDTDEVIPIPWSIRNSDG